MPNNNNRINFQVGYNVDQASVNAVKKSLQDLQNIKLKDFSGTKKDLDDIKEVAGKVQSALRNAFSVNLNSLNTQKFNSELQQAHLSIDTIYNTFAKAGAQGQVAFSRMASSVLTTNMQLKQTNSLISQMGETMANTVKWGIASSVMNNFTNSVQQAFQYVKSLDSALTDIRIVTGDSTEQMRAFAQEANNAAQSLGRSTMDYTKAALTFYQQGLDEEAVQARTQTVLKAQNITGAGQEMADYLTAVWNGYKVANQEAELYVDKLAAVADSSASNMSQLAIAMSKVASTANALGVDVDSLNAQIATIVATTRQAPESVGNALKTIYARMNDIKTGADDAEISLGNYSGIMAELGFNVLDADGNLRDTGDTIDEIGQKWATLSREQQIYLARTMAGQRQYNNLIALFDNWSKYSDLVNVSMDAQGTTMEKNERYMDSLAAKMQQFGAAGERVKDALVNEEDLKDLADFGANAVNLFGNLVESIGGGGNALLTFGSLFTQVFSGTIAKELNNVITNIQNAQSNLQRFNNDKANLKIFGQSEGYSQGIIQQMVDAKQAAESYYKYMSTAQINQHNQLIKNIAAAKEDLLVINQRKDAAEAFAKSYAMSKTAKGVGFSGANLDEKILSDDFQQVSGTSLLTIEALQDQIGNFSFEKPIQGLNTLKTAYNELKQQIGNKPLQLLDGSDKYQQALAKIKDEANPTATEVNRVKIALRNLLEETNVVITDAGTLSQIRDQSKAAGEGLELAKKKADQYLQAVKQFANVKTFVNMAAGLGQVASGINNIVNITRIWKNENLSAGQKILQTFTNLSMTIPMLVNGFTKVSDGFSKIVDIGRLSVLAKKAEAEATLEAAAAKEADAVANTADAGATVVNTEAQVALSAALKQVAIDAWAAIAPFAPYIAALAAVGVAAYALYKEWNKQSEAAQKAAQTAKAAKDTYEDLKNTYNDLKSSLENYNSAQEAINNMTKGTQEWRDAIRESNDAVLELIKNYPDLASQVENVNGKLVLSQKGQDEALARSAAAVDNARLASISATAESRQANLISNARESSRFVSAVDDTYTRQWVQTDQVLAVAKALHDDFSGYSRDLVQSDEKLASQIANQTGVSVEMVSAILQNVDNLDELATQLEANTEANKLAYESLASEQLQDNKTYQGLDNIEQQLVNSIVGADLQNAELDRIDHWMSIMTDGVNKVSSASNANVQEMLAALNKAQGTNWGLASNAVRGTDENRTFAFLDQQGKLIEWSAKQVASTIAASQALEGLSGSAEKATNILSDLQKLSGPSSDALTGYIANEGFENLKKDQLSGLDFTSGEIDSFINKHYLELGYKTGSQFANQLIKAQQESLKDWDSIGEGSLQPVKNAITNLFKEEDFSLGVAKGIGESLNNAFEQAGNKGLVSLKGLFENIDQSDIEDVTNAFENADISTPQGLLELQNILKGIGDGSILASEGWKDFKEAVESSQFVNPLDEIFERQASINSITKSLKSNSIISQQDYNTLLAANSQIEKMFRRTAQGYQFISQKGSLVKLVTGGTDGFIEAAKSYDSLKDTAKQLADHFGEDFKAGLLEDSKLSNAVKEAISQIDTADIPEDTKNQMYAALGMNQDTLKAVLDRYNQLLEKSSTGLSQGQESEFKQLQQDLQGFLDTAAGAPQIFNQITQSLKDAAAMGSQTLSELNDLFVNGDISGEQFGTALETVSDRQMSDLGFDVDEYETLVDLLQSTNEEMAENQYLARQMAKTNLRVSEGTEELIKNWQDWNDLLLDFQETGDMSGLADSWDQMREAFANLFNADRQSIDMLGPDFIANNLDKIQNVKNGVEGAYEELSALMDQELILKAYGVADFSQLDQEVQNAFNMIEQASVDANIQVGAVFTGNDALLKAFNDIVEEANWTSEQAQAAFSKMGFDVQVEEKPDAMHTKTETTQYYVPPSYTTEPLEYDLGPFGHGNLSIPVITPGQGGHYETAPGGTKQTYEPGAYSIKTVTKNGKSSGGNISRRQVSNSAPRKSSGGGGGRKGGSGGSKGSTKKPTIEKTTKIARKQAVSGTTDPYHDVNRELDKQADKLDKLQKKEKKLTGEERLQNLRKQNKELEKQKKTLEEKEGIAEGQLIKLRNQLIEDLGTNIKFDKNGDIANYNRALDSALDNYNKAIANYNSQVAAAEKRYNDYVAKYNKMSAEQQQKNKQNLEKQKDLLKAAQDSAQKTLDNQKDKYDRIKDNIKAYEDTQELIEDILKEEEQITEQIRDNIIQISKMKVTLSLDVGNLERDWIDFENKFIKKLDKEDLFGQAKASARELMSYFDSEQIKSVNDQLNKVLNDIDIIQKGGQGIYYGDRLAQAQQRLQELLDQQMEAMMNLQQLADDISETYLDALEDAKDKMDDQIDQYERVNDIIEHNVKLTQLLYGDKAYDTMQKYYNLQKDNNERELQTLKSQQDYWRNVMASFVNSNGEIINKKAFDEAKKNFDDLTNQVNSQLENMIDNLSKQWQNRVDGIIAKLNNAMTGGRGLDYLNEEWDYISNFDDNFLDTFESKMGIQQVTDLYQQAIDGLAGSPKDQQKINKLMQEQLKILREKDNLTQYDIDRAKAALQVEKARMALEDGRYNKTRMRLRRDSQGNYTYQYVADEEKLGELQSALADAQANLYNMDKEHYKQNLNTLYDTYKDYIEKMRDLTEEYNNTQDAAERERIQNRIDLLKESTNKLMKGLTEDNEYSLRNLINSYFSAFDVDLSQLSEEDKMEIAKNNIPFTGSSIQDLADQIVSEGGILNATSDSFKEVRDATKQYDDEVKRFLEDAGTNLENITEVTNDMGEVLDSNIKIIETLIPKYQELTDMSVKAINDIAGVMATVNDSLNTLISEQNLENLAQAYNTIQKINMVGKWFGTDSLLTGESKDNLIPDSAKDWGLNNTMSQDYNAYVSTNSEISPDSLPGLVKTISDAISNANLEGLNDINIEKLSSLLEYLSSSMDTMASNQIASLTGEASRYISTINNVEHLDQNVHIEANFPNVTQHTEIEQALNNLVNVASMRASSYGRR